MKRLSQLAGLAHFDAGPGKIYYFRTRTFGHGQASQLFPDLDPIDSDQGKFFISAFASSIPHPKK